MYCFILFLRALSAHKRCQFSYILALLRKKKTVNSMHIKYTLGSGHYLAFTDTHLKHMFVLKEATYQLCDKGNG